MNPYEGITKNDTPPKRRLKSLRVHAADNGRHIVTHEHHHPAHRDTHHPMAGMEELASHMAENAKMLEPAATGAEGEPTPAPMGGGGASPAGPPPMTPTPMMGQ